MSAPKHTPGPWTIDWNVSRLDIFSADAATLVATLRRSALSPGLDDAAKANARLIAAAPDLAAALEAFVVAEEEWLRQRTGMPAGTFDDPLSDALKTARAALAKARGEA